MIIACNCLNTFLSFNINQDQDLDSDSIPSSPSALSSSMPISSERYHKNTIFSKQLVDFRNNSKVQAVNDLQVNISQKDLILTIPIMNWELNYCFNCNKITHAVERKQQTSSNIIIINSSLQRKYEDIIASKSDPAFSTAFGIIMMNQQRKQQQQQSQQKHTNSRSDPEFRIRLKNLEKTLRQRIQSEIVATDERIKRHTEQQFALLKNFSDKSDSEYQNLASLVQNVPENLFEMQFYNDEDHDESNDPQNPTSNDVSDTSAINNTSTNTQQQQQQITSFDTPPATPESTPMSVGNSPIFRQQQLSQSAANNNCNGLRGPFNAVNNGAVHKNNTSIINNNNLDDCIFELEGLEAYPTSVGVMSDSTNGNDMSDDEYNNETEDAQDALGELDPIPSYGQPFTVASSLNVAKSVPIGIAQSFEDDQKDISRSRRNNFDSDDEVLDNNIDIAASIKAIARSVHGDKVFGDLPRPRFSYKI